MEFHVYETQQTIRAKHRPLIIITSNNEKELPDAFLRRCFFHYIRFPEPQTLSDIVQVHFPQLDQQLLEAALARFYTLRNATGLKKKPSTSEFLDWLELLLSHSATAASLSELDPTHTPFLGALIKNEQDLTLLDRLARYGR